MTRRNDIKTIKKEIENRGFVLLSTEYINNHSKIKIQCKKGHTWETTWKCISNGHGCPICYSLNPLPSFKYRSKYKEKRLEEIKQEVEKRGGECLSAEYINNFSSLIFKCENGHIWESTYKNVIISNSWCPVCLKETYLSIEDIKEIAKSRGGRCLSNSRGNRKLKWRCYFGHEWEASVSNVVGRGSWCPICSAGLRESICRLYFEELFNKPFPKSYPKWLKNSKKYQLELDGYCEELKLAFEHNGRQHYKKDTIYSSPNLYSNDLEKMELCENYNIKLIIIPELCFYTEVDSLRNYIISECEKQNIVVPFPDINIDHSKIYFLNNQEYYLREAKNIAEQKGGKCLSNIYIDSSEKLIFCCEFNHIWKTTLSGVRKGWCPKCVSISKRKTIQDARELAKSKNGKCLSAEYTNNYTKMTWECSCGNIWNATYNSIQKTWCPQCGIKLRAEKKKLSIEVYKEIAKQKGGECLSNEYNSCFEKLTWKCSKGHIWEARADQIKNTSRWCPYCSGRRK